MSQLLLELALVWVHGLSAAAWFGAIFYRTLVVDGKALGFFPRRADYEHFSTHLAHNMRYFVSAVLLLCGLSGFALEVLKLEAAGDTWLAFAIATGVVWLAACGLFAYVSWVHWKWRACASADEFESYRREGQRLAGAMVLLSGTGFALGQACRVLAW